MGARPPGLTTRSGAGIGGRRCHTGDVAPTHEPAPATTGAPPRDERDRERRGIVLAAAGVFGALAVLVVVAVVFSGDAGDQRTVASTEACAPDDRACIDARGQQPGAGIIPQPGEGRAPQEAGDRGGTAQVALLALLLVAMAAIVGLVVRSSRRARAGRAAPPDLDRPRAGS